MKPIIYSARDHAAINADKITCYYGPLETDPKTGDWCFCVYKNYLGGSPKEVFRATNEQLLDVAAGEKPSDLLIAGLALYLSK